MTRYKRTQASTLTAALVLVVFVLPGGTADTEAGNLPGGTAIEVSIDTPAHGEVLTIPPGETSLDVELAGMASVGEAEPVADTTIIYVLDASGSTGAGSGVDCGPDQNGDGAEDTVLDCEIEGIISVNDEAIAQGTVDEAGLVVFGNSAAAADMQADAGDQTFTLPGSDVATVAQSAFTAGGVDQFTPRSVGGLTNFEAAVQSACNVGGSASNPNVLILFLSDGIKSAGGDPTAAASACGGPTIHTFAIGTRSTCGDASNPDDLASIAAATGGDCTVVLDPSNLATVVPAFIESALTGLTASVDGAAASSLAGALTSGAIPSTGPTTVTYSKMLTGLAPGMHSATVTATGRDGGGQASLADTHRFTIQNGVHVDVKPTSCPNPLKVGPRGGVVPVAVLGSATFDATAIDPESVRLEGVAPLRWSLEDLAAPFDGAFSDPLSADDCTTEADDGFVDLGLKFDRADVAAAIEAGHGPLADGQVVLVTVSGEHSGGLLFEGHDVVRVHV